ncbi:hypothetical protein AB0C91_40355 [Streptomyces sp. NPDC048674]|uniref:hypothetical protein n=1 Tax=Streptomyces sp. NPDC048674 TaxID=3155491 RepID=UPI0034206B81
MDGIENVGADVSDSVLEHPVPEGHCAVVVHLIDWQAEAGGQDKDGRPVPGALPDFVVLINPTQPGQGTFRTARLVDAFGGQQPRRWSLNAAGPLRPVEPVPLTCRGSVTVSVHARSVCQATQAVCGLRG